MRLRWPAALMGLMGAACLSACGDDSPPTPSATDLSVVTQTLDVQLNDPAQQIREGLKQANADKRIYPQELFVRGEGRLTPVDWWAYRQGLIRVAGVDAYLAGYFGLTPKGQAMLAAPVPRWLASSFKGKPQVSCEGSRTSGTCKVSGTAQVAPTAEGAPLFEGRAVPDQSFNAVVQYDPSGWSVQEFHTTGSVAPQDLSRRALLGDDETITKARDRFAVEVNRQVK
jgi:hypothetical protein